LYFCDSSGFGVPNRLVLFMKLQQKTRDQGFFFIGLLGCVALFFLAIMGLVREAIGGLVHPRYPTSLPPTPIIERHGLRRFIAKATVTCSLCGQTSEGDFEVDEQNVLMCPKCKGHLRLTVHCECGYIGESAYKTILQCPKCLDRIIEFNKVISKIIK
jgi:hypothetical protein